MGKSGGREVDYFSAANVGDQTGQGVRDTTSRRRTHQCPDCGGVSRSLLWRLFHRCDPAMRLLRGDRWTR